MDSGPLKVRLLGEARISVGGGGVRLPTRKALALIAYLSLEGQTSRAHLAGLLWSDFYDDQARKNLRQELHRLGATPLGACLDLTPEHVGLRGQIETDVEQFWTHARQGALEAALNVYGGPLLAGLELRGAAGFGDWLSAWRDRLAAERLALLERLLEGRGASSDLRGALEVARTLIADDEFQERHHRAAMRLHLALGEREAALQVFGRCRDMLEREFALEPLPETRALADQAQRRVPPVPAVADATPSLEPPLVGRVDVWAHLERAWSAGRSVVLAGESGVGKSRLLREFAHSKGRVYPMRGQPLDGGVPFATVARAVREVLAQEPDLALPAWVRLELSRLVPELGEPPQTPLRSEEDRLRLFGAYVEFLAAFYSRFDVLLSDDLQFFDASSHELNLYAAAQLAERGLRRPTLGSLRRDELRPEAGVSLERLTRAAELIELAPLSEGAVAELIGRLSGRAAVLFPRRLYAATGGNVFFMLETLRSLFESGELRAAEGGEGWATAYDDATEDYRELPLPPSVRQAVLTRTERLGAAARRLLEVGSLAGEPFTLETISQVSALAEWEALEALEGSTSAQLLRVDGNGYRFVHDLARRALAESQGPERRRLIHRRLAQQLRLSGGPPAVVAAHLEQANLPSEAADAWLEAAQAAQQVYANREALAHLGRALAVLPAPEASAPQHFDLRARREALARELGEREIQQTELDAMAALATDASQQLTVALRRSNFLSLTGHPHAALDAAQQAHALARQVGSSNGCGEALIRLASALYYVEDFQAALARITEAIELPMEEQNVGLGGTQLVLALNLRGILHSALGDLEAALADYADALLAWRTAPDPLLRARLSNNRATVLCLYGAYAPAHEDASAALELTRRHGFRQLQGFALDTHARALRGLGHFNEAQAALEAATTLGRLTGNHRLVSHCLHHGVQLLNDQGHFAAALTAADAALASASATESRSNRILTLAARAQAWLALGNPQRALTDAQQAAQLDTGSLREALPESVQLVLGQALQASGQATEAETVFAAARDSLNARLERLHSPAWRLAFTALPLWQALFGPVQP
ncbi:ATP-binding protein [Deinococcus marmoris]|uniref:Transcriptional regulator, SARP family n=1 Tax=Deinococcus marmoris TaxID=249408 RepID=A0A1U7P4B9_9DEIO|nr:BTAD domain-containing putative transcriptional regulator [Deinococcus marmoris]OLV20009.1 transcriptional regulator, SARP family [Deinococcus marmoris]